MITRRRFAGIAAASALAPAFVGRAAFAQSWPTRFVRFIVPFPAGVAPDIGWGVNDDWVCSDVKTISQRRNTTIRNRRRTGAGPAGVK